MSKENVEIVRRVYEAAADRDVDALFSLYDEDVLWDASRTQRGALAGHFASGHEALRAWFRQWYGAWESIDDDLEELIEAGDDEVIAVMVQRARGRASGIEVDNRLAAVWTIRRAKVVRVVWYPSLQQALEATD